MSNSTSTGHYLLSAAAQTPLVGREQDITSIRAMLDVDHNRLITLTGPGGVGKTRLALAVAHSLQDDFAHGVHVAALASIQHPDLVPTVVAQSFGVALAGDVPVDELLHSLLRDQHLLLLLDNLEHLVDGIAPWVSDLLADCPRLKVLATSRVALRIAGEQQAPVAPLDAPDISGGLEIDRVRASSAVQLFVARAHAVSPAIALNEDTAPDIAAVCRAVDGVPLAIELAAAQVAMLSLPSLRQRLTHRLTVLTEGRRDAPARHRTMRHAIGWSYELLSRDQQRLLRWLAVFIGGFPLDAADATQADAEPAPDGLETLSALVEHNLVRLHPAPEGNDRFEMLETIREFGHEQLVAQDEADAARDAHARYFLDLVASMQQDVRHASPGERTRAQVSFLNRLEMERDNLRAVLEHLIHHGRIEEAMTLAVAIWPFRGSMGHDIEARETLEALLVHAQGQGRTAARAAALLSAATYAESRGDSSRAMETFEEASSIFQEHGCLAEEARVQHGIAWVLLNAGQLDAAITHYHQSLDLARESGDLESEADALDMLGWTYLNLNDHISSRQYLTEALQLSIDAGYRRIQGAVLSHLASLALREDDTARAATLLRESDAIAREIGDWHLRAPVQMILAQVARLDGDLATARALMLEELDFTRKAGYSHGIAMSLTVLGCLALMERDHAAAIDHLKESLPVFLRIGLGTGVQHSATIAFDAFACIAMETSEPRSAARFLGMADGILARSGADRLEGKHAFVDQARLDPIRALLADPVNRAAWETACSLDDQAMVDEALTFNLPQRPASPGSMAEQPDTTMGLSSRELEVLRLVADGLTNQEIAEAIFLSPRTVENHVGNILGKLALTTRTGAVAYAIRNGLA